MNAPTPLRDQIPRIVVAAKLDAIAVPSSHMTRIADR